jgi:MerR family transcriptional regulator, copper efflux regulator
MKTGELVRRSGLTRQMVSSYCMYGLIHEAVRTPGGHRLFDVKTITRLKLIRQLLAHGYTLRDIREIFLRGKR